jgi:hypothetical protein
MNYIIIVCPFVFFIFAFVLSGFRFTDSALPLWYLRFTDSALPLWYLQSFRTVFRNLTFQ